MTYEEVRRVVDQLLGMKHERPALNRLVEYVVRNARCIVTGECLLETSGRRLVCDEKRCWWEGS